MSHAYHPPAQKHNPEMNVDVCEGVPQCVIKKMGFPFHNFNFAKSPKALVIAFLVRSLPCLCSHIHPHPPLGSMIHNSITDSYLRLQTPPISGYFPFVAGWLGPASWAMSLFSATIVVALCRRKSTRLTAVLGGLVLALGILFTSFATQLHQVAFSYGKYTDGAGKPSLEAILRHGFLPVRQVGVGGGKDKDVLFACL